MDDMFSQSPAATSLQFFLKIFRVCLRIKEIIILSIFIVTKYGTEALKIADLRFFSTLATKRNIDWQPIEMHVIDN